MAKEFRFTGLMAPVFTPLKKDGSLNIDVIPDYAKYLTYNGINGVYVTGTAGEGVSLTVQERKRLTEAWTRTDLPVMAMVGATALKDTQDLAQHAESVGVSAIAALPSLYYKPVTVVDLVDYCSDVAAAAPNTPFYYYHIPFMTGVKLSMEEFFAEGGRRIETLRGMKFTSGEVSTDGLQCLRLSSGRFNILSGMDDTLKEALFMGYDGAINVSINFLCKEVSSIFNCAQEAKAATVERQAQLSREADAQQQRINQILGTIYSFTGGFSISSLKAAMEILTGIDVGPPQKPLKPLSEKDVQQMRAKLSPLI